MKKLLLPLLICLYSAAASAHPGKTDKYGGHKCLKDCEEWGLFYEEYHLHDKDWKPIRVLKKKARQPRAVVISEESPTLTNEPVPQPVIQTVTTTQYVTIVKEDAVFPFNPLLLVLLVLLMLLLIFRLNRRKKEEAAKSR